MKILVILISLLIIPGAFFGFIDSFTGLVNTPSVLIPVLIGFGAGLFLYYVAIRRWYAFTTFEHELTHAIVALLFLRRIIRFVSTANDGGYVQHSGGFGGKVGNVLILLAPYYLPTFTIIACLFRPLIPISWINYFDGFLGLTLGYHMMSTIDELKENFNSKTFYLAGTSNLTKTDIGMTGIVTSFFMIIALTLLLHGVVFYMLTGGYPAAGAYFSNVAWKAWGICLWVYHSALLPLYVWLNVVFNPN